MTPQPSFVPDGYTLERLLGSGNTSHVFEARHEHFGSVALKLPKEDMQRDPVLRRMFENEVQMTRALKHDRVVSAFEGYPTGEGAFLALEFCDSTLDAQLRPDLPLQTAYCLILDVAQGLQHSHQRQILHRDVKPANVFIKGGRAKLGDFGTGAYVADVFGAPQPSGKVGTAFYMAPEIFQGQPAAVKSDIYSLGVLAYEVIAGVRPFGGQNEDELMLAHASSVPPPLRGLRPEVSLEVASVVATAMSRTLPRRFDNMNMFVSVFAEAAGLPASESLPQIKIGRAGRNLGPHASSHKTAEPDKTGLFGWFGRKRS